MLCIMCTVQGFLSPEEISVQDIDAFITTAHHSRDLAGGPGGGPLSHTIFNVVVYAFLRHWVAVVEETEDVVNPGAASTEGFGRDVKRLESYSYA